VFFPPSLFRGDSHARAQPKAEANRTVDGSLIVAVLDINRRTRRVCLALCPGIAVGPDAVQSFWLSIDQEIQVEQKGRIALLEIRFDKCRLGFEFPRFIDVHRLEVVELETEVNRNDLRDYVRSLRVPLDVGSGPRSHRGPVVQPSATSYFSESA